MVELVSSKGTKIDRFYALQYHYYLDKQKRLPYFLFKFTKKSKLLRNVSWTLSWSGKK